MKFQGRKGREQEKINDFGVFSFDSPLRKNE
jgi:hypothetical protein